MRHSLKFWWRYRGAAVWVVGSLGLAIGLTTAVWSIAEATWFQPLPGPDPDRLVSVGFRSDGIDRSVWTPFSEYLVVRERQDAFTDVAAISREDDWFLDEPGDLVDVNAARVTANVLEVLGVAPMLGRSFSQSDVQPGASEVAIISFRLWRSAFGSSVEAIGRRVAVSVASGGSRPVQIVAVLPPDVTIRCDEGRERDFFVTVPEEWRGSTPKNYGGNEPSLLARLRPTVSISVADTRMTALWQAIDRESPPLVLPGGVRARGPRTSSLVPLHELWYGSARKVLVPLSAAAILVMLVACTNVCGVLLALASGRSKEFAIRSALGERSRQRWGSLLLELAPMTLGVTTLSVLSAPGFVAAFVTFAPPGFPRLAEVRVDWRAAAVGLAAAVITVASLGVTVAILQVRRRRLLPDLQGAGFSSMTPGALRVRRVLIAAQVGVVLALLTAASLVTGSLWRLLNQPLGFDISRVLSAGVMTTQSYYQEPGRYMQFIDDLRREVLAAPGRREVAVTVDPPLGQGRDWIRVTFLDGTYRAMETKAVSDGFFGVMGIPIVAGRDLMRFERDGCALLVNTAFARTYFGGIAGAVGQQVVLGGGRCHIVGVSGDVRDGPLAGPMVPAIYPVFSSRLSRRQIYLVTREDGSLEDGVRNVREAIRRAAPTAYVTVSPLSARIGSQTAPTRIGMTVLGALSGFTLLLASLGIAATIAQVSVERRRELAIRCALGASARSVVVLMMRVVAFPTACGVLIGGVLSWWSSPLLDRLLFGTSPFDPGLWCAGVGVLATVVSVAAWLPARRANTTDLLSLLRQE
jgi:predicted permease